MLQYYGFIALVLLQALLILGRGNTPGHRKLFCVIAALDLFIIIGFHSVNVGIDTLAYADNFTEVSYLTFFNVFSSQSYMEVGFILYNKILSLITLHPQVLFIASGAIISIAVIRYIYKNTALPLLAFIIYLSGIGDFYWTLSAIRQSLAIAVTLFAFEAIQKRRLFIFILLVFIASTFHKSALCVLPLYPLYNVKFNIKTAFVSMFAALLVFINIDFILNNLVEYLPVYQGYLASSGDSYLTDGLIRLFLLLFPVFVLFFTYKKADKDFNILLWYSFLALILSVFVFKFYMLIRVKLYFSIASVILIPKAFELISRRNTKIVFMAVFLFFTFLYTQKTLSNLAVSNNFLPYEFFWQNPTAERRWNFTDGYMPW